MATIEQPMPQVEKVDGSDRDALGPLNYLLARTYALNWELIFYVVIFVAAILTRFVNLGDRVMSHDESLHTNYSYGLYKTGVFEHTPLMHGPLLFHATALMYLLFGASDFTARLYPAILGIIMVMMPRLLFSKWLGKLGSAVASVMLLISPMVLFHNRYIREDTPSIFFTLLMVYAIFAYLDGNRRRHFGWLLLLSAAMLLSLASKEVGFMYVAIFGLVLTLFWLLQVIQGLRRGEVKPIIGWLLGVPIGLAVLFGVSGAVGVAGASGLSAIGINLSSNPTIATIVIATIALLIFGALGLLLFQPIRDMVSSLGQHGKSVYQLVIAGIIIGTVGALGATCVLSIAQGSPSVGLDPVLTQIRQNQWFIALIVPLVLIVVGTALIRFTRSPWMGVALMVALAGLALVALVDLPIVIKVVLFIALLVAAGLLIGMLRAFTTVSVPWPDVFIILGTSAVTGAVLTFLEERSKQPSVSAIVGPPFIDAWLYAPWIVAAVIIAGLLALRFYTPFFEEMKRYPAFDVMMLMGTLILPWLAAFPVFAAHYPLGDNSLSAATLDASLKAVVPFIAVAITAGLCWNPALWIPCTAVFYALFAFFYTTMFTNGAGIGTGLIGSLGYWLSQQGVRRGSQPQYYYLFVELPVYEYLPVIGAAVAGVVGLLGLWRFRMARYADEPLPSDMLLQPEEYEANPEFSGESDTSDAMVETVATPIQTMAMAAPVERLEPLPGEETEPVEEADPLADLPVDDEQPLAASFGQMEEIPPAPFPLRPLAEAEKLEGFPFLPFVGVWAVLLIMFFTMAGEKMPWLTTHLTIPLIFITAWYVGTLLEQVEVPAFLKQGWVLIALTPILGIAVANVVGPFVLGNVSLGGLQRDQLLQTFTWFGAILLVVLLLAGMYWIWKRIGTSQTIRTVIIGVFVLLAIMTARTAWMAAYINYDYATEFMVYAHGAPADKQIMNQLQDISERTTGGMDIKVAYDSAISWPGTWYFRDYPKATFLGDTPALNDLDQYTAIVVGTSNNPKVEPVLKDNYYEFKYTRLWWPMQDYDHLDFSRIDNLFASDNVATNAWNQQNWKPGDKLREGIWQIWWNRNYDAYGDATGSKFDVADWPLHDTMYFYVKKDVAAQVWNYIPSGAVNTALPVDPFNNVRCDACAPDSTFGEGGNAVGQLNHPRDMTVGPDGNLYVMDSLNTRVQIFSPDGAPLRQFGTASAGDQGGADGTFREPWGIAVANDGTIYVADTWNHRVEVFDKNGTFLRKWGEFAQMNGDDPGPEDSFWGPRDIAVDAQNHVYVADTGNKRVRVYDSQGKFLYDIGHDPNGIELNEPVGLAVDNQRNELYIADTWDKRIEVVSLTGPAKEVASFSLQAWASTTESANRPYLALDSTGNDLFITDPDSSRVLVMDAKTGQALAAFTTPGGVLGGIAVDPAGHIYVADTANGQISRYEITSIPSLAPVAPQQPPANVNPGTESATDTSF